VQEPYEVRPARPGDLSEIVELLRTCLGQGGVPRTIEFWRWKHERNPFGESPVLVAEAGGRIVGLRAFLRWTWRAGGRDVPAVRAVDTATHPHWRGRGVFSRLTRELADRLAREGTAFVFNTPNRRSRPGYLEMGWRPAGRLPLFVRLFPTGVVQRPDGLPEDDATVAELLAHEGIPDFLAALERSRDDGRFHTPATPAYLRWRYAEAPGLLYGAAWATGDEAAAAIVYRLRRRWGLRELSMSEVLAAPHPESIARAADLVEEVADAAAVHHAVAVAAPGTPEHAALRRAGFRRVPNAGPRLFVRELSPTEALPDLRNPASWRPSTGSFELF